MVFLFVYTGLKNINDETKDHSGLMFFNNTIFLSIITAKISLFTIKDKFILNLFSPYALNLKMK